MRQLGPYKTHEVPPSLAVTFVREESGGPIDLTGYTAKWIMVKDSPTADPAEQRSAVVVAPATGGVAQYDWVDGDMAEGVWLGEMWVSDGTNRLASETYRWVVEPSLATPVFP